MNGTAAEPWYWQNFDLFEHTASTVREAFFAGAQIHEVRRGEVLFRADDPAVRVYWLDQGLVKIFHLSPLGEIITFWFCVPGDPFGAGGISGAEEQAVFAQALERSVVYSVGREEFEALVRAHPQLGLNMIKLVSARLRLACDGLADRITRRTDARLARVLLRLGRNWGEGHEEGGRFRVRITHQELGQMVGACRQTISRTLNDFERQRLVRTERRQLIVTDVAGLSLLAGERIS